MVPSFNYSAMKFFATLLVMQLKKSWEVIKRATENTIVTHDGIEHAGYLSFLGLLAAFPFMVFLVALAGFLGQGELGREFLSLMRSYLPYDVVQALLPRVDEIVSGPSPGLLTLSMLAALWTASSAVEGYRTILNRAYHVGTPPAYIWRRLLSIIQLLVFTFLILIGMLVLVFFPLALENVETWLGIDANYGGMQQWSANLKAVSILMLFVVVANMYYILPNVKQSLRAVLPGAAITVLLWLGTTKVFTYYVTGFDQMNLIYGSLGGIIAALLFFYLLNIIFIFGAELNYQLIRAHGEKVEEKEDTAEGVTEDNIDTDKAFPE
jgi:membrane protein